MQRFSKMYRNENNQLSFKENEYSAHEVMSCIVENKISLLKIEREEPTLESLFMEEVSR